MHDHMTAERARHEMPTVRVIVSETLPISAWGTTWGWSRTHALVRVDFGEEGMEIIVSWALVAAAVNTDMPILPPKGA